MKLVNPLFINLEIDTTDCINTIIIEDKKVFTSFINELVKQSENKNTGGFVLSKNNICLDFHLSSNIYINYFHDLIDSKSVNVKLNKYLQALILEKMNQENYDLMIKLNEYLEKLCSYSEVELTYDGGDNIFSIIKAAGLKVLINSEQPLERLFDNIDVINKLFTDQIFFLISPRQYFNDEELFELYKIAKYKQWNIITIENKTSNINKVNNDYEKLTILDQDLCVI